MLQLCRRYREGGGDRQAEFPTVLGPICELHIVVYESILQYIICTIYIHTHMHTLVYYSIYIYKHALRPFRLQGLASSAAWGCRPESSASTAFDSRPGSAVRQGEGVREV